MALFRFPLTSAIVVHPRDNMQGTLAHLPLLFACMCASCFTFQHACLTSPGNLCLQDAPAVLFCCENRAIICRDCDVMIHTANEFTAKHNRHILFQVAAGLKALPPPGPGRPDTSSQIASDTASAATHTHMDKAGSQNLHHHVSSPADMQSVFQPLFVLLAN